MLLKITHKPSDGYEQSDSDDDDVMSICAITWVPFYYGAVDNCDSRTWRL